MQRSGEGVFVHAGRAACPLDERRHPFLLEPLEDDPLDCGFAPQVGERRSQRVIGSDFGVAVRADDDQGGGPCPYDVAKQRQGGRRGPVQVIQHEHEGAVARRSVDKVVHRLEEPVTVTFGTSGRGWFIGEPAHQLGRNAAGLGAVRVDVGTQLGRWAVGHVVTERFGEGLIGHAQLFVATPVEHPGAAGVSLPGEVADQRRLPHARLPRDQHNLAAMRYIARSRVPRRRSDSVFRPTRKLCAPGARARGSGMRETSDVSAGSSARREM